LIDTLGSVRSTLDKHGISLGLQSTDEVFGNPNGGRAQGATFFGQTALGLGIDLNKAIDLEGGIFNVSAYQTYGHGISASNIDNLSLVSNIEATRSARLFELWYQQSLFGGAADVRLGQLAADQEFIITQYGAWLINSAFGWPTLPTIDLPAGGPEYPLATPGIRLRVKPVEPLTLFFAAFNGNPAGPGLGNPQLRDSSGTLFRLGDGIYAIAEAQWAIESGKNGGGPPITLKVGGWYHNRATPNQFFATDGLTGVAPASPGSPISHARTGAAMPLLTSCCFRGPTAREVWPFLHVPKARQLSVARSAPSWPPALSIKAPSAATATTSVLPSIQPALASHWAAPGHSRRNTRSAVMRPYSN
jgi:porin